MKLVGIAAIATDRGPLVIMGDLRTLTGRTGPCDSRAGFGLQASFPVDLPILRIPIDHVLVRCTIGIRDRRIARDVGSDHLPVIVDLVVP